MPLNIGQHTYGNPILRGNHNTVNIGKYCSIAANVVFDCGFDHNYRFVSTWPFAVNWGLDLPINKPITRDINVGNDVWIGEDSLITEGCTIGNGAVIGARSIITKDIEPYSIVVGHHRVLKKRFSDEQIEQLLAIAWWNWSDDKVRQHAHLLQTEDIQAFLNHADNS